jgi:glycosyltransferase involved in cell wall biosynthesis
MAKIIGMILDESFPPDPRVENEANLLIKAGFKLKLFCLGETTNKEMYNGIEVHRYKASSFVLDKLSALAYTFPFYKHFLVKHLSDFFKNNEIDILHINDIRVAEAVHTVNKKYQYPIVQDLHENRPEIMKLYKFVNTFPGNILINLKKWKRKEELYVKKANKVIVVTEEAKKELLERTHIAENKIISIPNTPLQSFYTDYTIDERIIDRYKDSFTILYIGETGLRRGIENAIEAIAMAKEEIPNIKLLLIGKSKDDAYLKERVKALDIEEYVDYQGWQSPNTFASYISASKIGISPLIRNIHHDTTYANKIFQYMAFGLPLVVSDCPAQANVANDYMCGLVHKAGDSKALADCFKNLYNNKDLFSHMQKNAQRIVKEKFHWEKTGASMIDLYTNL